MCAHTVTRPFGLAYPTPFKVAPSSCANHVHAATRSFCRCPTFWTRFCKNFYRHFGSFVPSRISDTIWIDRVFTCGRVIDGGGVWKAFTDVVSLTTGFAENKLCKGKLLDSGCSFKTLISPHSHSGSELSCRAHRQWFPFRSLAADIKHRPLEAQTLQWQISGNVRTDLCSVV